MGLSLGCQGLKPPANFKKIGPMTYLWLDFSAINCGLSLNKQVPFRPTQVFKSEYTFSLRNGWFFSNIFHMYHHIVIAQCSREADQVGS